MNWPPKNGIAKTWRTAASIRGYAASCCTTWLVASNCKTQTCQWGIFNSFLMFSWLPSVICKGNSLCVTSLDNYLAMANYWPQQVGTPTPGGRPWRRTLPLRLLSGHWCRRSESFWRSFGLFFEDQTITNACFHLGLGTSENGVHIPPKFSSKKKDIDDKPKTRGTLFENTIFADCWHHNSQAFKFNCCLWLIPRMLSLQESECSSLSSASLDEYAEDRFTSWTFTSCTLRPRDGRTSALIDIKLDQCFKQLGKSWQMCLSCHCSWVWIYDGMRWYEYDLSKSPLKVILHHIMTDMGEHAQALNWKLNNLNKQS